MVKVITYKVIDLDVWAGEEEGSWQVNDLFDTGGTVEIAEDASDADIVAALVAADYLQDDVIESDIDIDGDPEHIMFIDQSEDSLPLFQLRAE